ncbi:MAG: DGQHR domain-containing protein [Candidatus Micrarchaeales archaeon]
MKLNAIETTQNGITFYVTKTSVGEILEHGVKVDRFNPETNDGYQRDISRDRARKFGKFLKEGDTISPLPLLVSVRGEKVSFKDGTLEIPDATTLWLIDGQHRYEGLKELVTDDPSYRELEVPLVLVSFKDNEDAPAKVQEAILFNVINRTQKGVRSDLSDRFIKMWAEQSGGVRNLIEKYNRGGVSILKDAEVVTRAIGIMDIMVATKDGPWNDRVDKPGQRGGIAKQRSFTESLKIILSDSDIRSERDEQIAKILNNYWGAFRTVCGDAFENPKDYAIQKTTGLYVLHEVFNKIANYCKDDKGNLVLTEEKFVEKLKKIGHGFVTSAYWKTQDDKNGSAGEGGRVGTSRKAFKQLTEEIKGAIDESLSGAAKKVIV